MVGDARWRAEQQFHDEQAAQRAQVLQFVDHRFADEAYLNHESWITPAFTALGDVRGQHVLDLGCGHGMASIVLARQGAQVTACDLSLGYVREAERRAQANHVDLPLVVCNAECLPFPNESFARIWGSAILHHLDIARAARELHRVLTPGGVAVFCEPWGGNRWLNWARAQVPYPEKHRTADEMPLRQHDLNELCRRFPCMTVHGYQFLSMLGRVYKHRVLVSGLRWCDDVLLARLPGWQRYCRYVVIRIEKTE